MLCFAICSIVLVLIGCVLRAHCEQGEGKDLIFILTDCLQFCLLEYNTAKAEIVTRAKGTVFVSSQPHRNQAHHIAMQSRVGKVPEDGISCTIDPLGRMICLRLYEGLLKVGSLVNRITSCRPS